MRPDGAQAPRVARFVSGGFLSTRIRRIAWLAGIDLKPGLPKPGEAVAAWGHAGTAARAEAVARRYGVPLLRFEDPFLRSLHPGRSGEPPLGLLIDAKGCHFDAGQPSELETLLAETPFDDGGVIERARRGIDAIRATGVTKYAATRPDLTPPDPGYVLVLDQTRDDASIRLGGASAATFREMLLIAREENPGARILIKSHPDTQAGHRAGHYSEADAVHGAVLETRPLPPALLLEGALAVYTVSSQTGFEAIVVGHRPVCFGKPFWSGWGLDDDRVHLPRRQRALTRTQLFAGAMVLYPKWYDPHRDRLCDPEDVAHILDARARAWREDRQGWAAPDMRLWKRAPLRRFFGGRIRYRAPPGMPALVWGMADLPDGGCRLEDGFLRSRGLGADLVPPLSLVLDGQGLYYDPSRPSELETAIRRAADMPPETLGRAGRLRQAIVDGGVSKYNLDAAPFTAPPGMASRRAILVPGQVADDASMIRGAGQVADNAALLRAVRAANPDAFVIYKPHPDVEAGLRDGAIAAPEADLIATDADPISLLGLVSAVWTMTSLLGFEALLRGVPVTTFGAPFYAGWGLTDDRGPAPARRRAARPSLEALVHAVLIDYPRYYDPVIGQPCPPEIVVHRLAHGPLPPPGPGNRLLAKAQGALASWPWLWR